jgi:hypothetical protein
MIGTVEQTGFTFSEPFRQEMIRWLARMDSNGVFRDVDSAAEGMGPITIEAASEIAVRWPSTTCRPTT